MKYNINREVKKMESGGMFATFTPYIPDSGNPAPKQAAASPEKGESILDEEIMKELIKAGGLITDTNHLTTELAMLELSPLAYTSKGNRSQVMKLLAKVNELKVNKEMYSEAVKLAQSNGALNEVAIGNYGELFVKEKDGNIKAISTSDYLKSGGKKKVLTMSELMNERQYNPKLAWNSSIFSVANSSIGSEKIFSTIKGMIAAFGSESSEKTSWASTADLKGQLGEELKNKPTKSEMASLQKLAEIANSPGSYVEIKNTIKTERNHLDKGLSYIWGSLSKPAQAKLSVIASMNGKTPKDLITEMMISQTDHEESSSYTPHAKISGESEENTAQKPLSNFQMFFKNSMKGVWSDFMMNDPNFGSMFKGMVGSKSPLLSKKDESIPMTTLENVLGSFQYSSLVDSNNMYFGGNKISSVDFKNLIFNNKEDAGIVYLPVKNDGSPDYDSFERFKEANKIFELNKENWSDSQIKNHFSKYHFNVNISTTIDKGRDVSVLAESSNVKPFLIMSGYTNDAVENLTDKNSWITKLSSDEEEVIKPQLEGVWTVGNGKNAINLTPKNFFGEDYYKGVILAPVKTEAPVVADAFSGFGPTADKPSILDVQRNIRGSNSHLIGGLNPNTSSQILQ